MFVCMCVMVFSANVEFLHSLTGSGDPEEHKHPLAPPTLPSHLGYRGRGVVCVCEEGWGGGVRNVGEERDRGQKGERHPYCQTFDENSHQSTDAINTSTSVTGL